MPYDDDDDQPQVCYDCGATFRDTRPDSRPVGSPPLGPAHTCDPNEVLMHTFRREMEEYIDRRIQLAGLNTGSRGVASRDDMFAAISNLINNWKHSE